MHARSAQNGGGDLCARGGRLPCSLQYIVDRLQSMKEFSPSLVSKVVCDGKVGEGDLRRYARFDHPPNECYGRELVYDGGYFKLMVMSWSPGDYSAIHDHGYMQWGAVQVFGEAEQAEFVYANEEFRTVVRERIGKYRVLATDADVVHQMGNPGTSPFLTLQIYGNQERRSGVTDDACVFDFVEGCVKRTDGGAFFSIDERDVKRRELAPSPDFATWLRHLVEMLRRIFKCCAEFPYRGRHDVDMLVRDLFDVGNRAWIMDSIGRLIGEDGRVCEMGRWNVLQIELQQAAQLQRQLLAERVRDSGVCLFHSLADGDIVAGYLRMFFDMVEIGALPSILSIGHAAGVAEEYMLDALGVESIELYCMDVLEGLKRVESIGDLGVGDRQWDVLYAGLCVFHHVGHEEFEKAVRCGAMCVKDGGYFVGDFVTTNFFRHYPSALVSDDGHIISLCTPQVVHKGEYVYQRNCIINIRCRGQQMRILSQDDRDLYMPSMDNVRQCFEKYFRDVRIFNAVTLHPVEKEQDMKECTRYVLVAKK